MSWVSRHISLSRLLRNWGIVYVGNLVGALSIVVMLPFGDWWEQADGALGGTALSIATAKASLPVSVVIFRGILANALVCLAVWLASAGRTVTDRILAIVFPISAFVAAGFEHSVAKCTSCLWGWRSRAICRSCAQRVCPRKNWRTSTSVPRS